MAIITEIERQWIGREEGAVRIQKLVSFLFKAPNYHEAFPHWMDG